nr:uncharacterized protein LOC116157531 [Camelus dromedarius]
MRKTTSQGSSFQETCSSKWAQGCLGRSQEWRGTLAVSEELGGTSTPTPGEHRQARALGRVGPAQTQAGAHPAAAPIPAARAPRPRLRLRPGRAPSPSAPPGASPTRGGEETAASVAAPYLSCQGLHPGSGPTGDRRPGPSWGPAPPAWAARRAARHPQARPPGPSRR